MSSAFLPKDHSPMKLCHVYELCIKYLNKCESCLNKSFFIYLNILYIIYICDKIISGCGIKGSEWLLVGLLFLFIYISVDHSVIWVRKFW